MYFMSLIQHFIACGEGLGIRRYLRASLPADHGTYKNGVGSWNCVFSDKCNSTMDHVVLWEQQRIQVGQVGTSVYFIGRWVSFTSTTLSTYLTVRCLKTQSLHIYIVLCINLLCNFFCFENVAGIVS